MEKKYNSANAPLPTLTKNKKENVSKQLDVCKIKLKRTPTTKKSPMSLRGSNKNIITYFEFRGKNGKNTRLKLRSWKK
jgi:hypothetical protein